MLPTRELSLALLVVLASISVSCLAMSDQGTVTSGFKESTNDEPQQQLDDQAGRAALNSIRANSRLLAVPHSLARFLFYNSRGPSEVRQAPTTSFEDSPPSSSGYKRSSSQLDALNGVTLGKRSAPAEFVNYEPIFGRQSLLRAPARVYDMRWAPFDSINESPSVFGRDY